MNTPLPLIPPQSLLNDIVSREVSYVTFEGGMKTGTIEVHRSIEEDIQGLFNLMLREKFPLTSVTPLSAFNGSDEASMSANNTYCFGFRTITNKPHLISIHGYGCAIDINPRLNPYIKEGTVLPPEGTYNLEKPGTLRVDSPVVRYMKERGFVWGGDWDKPYKDYHHFEKELPEKEVQRY